VDSLQFVLLQLEYEAQVWEEITEMNIVRYLLKSEPTEKLIKLLSGQISDLLKFQVAAASCGTSNINGDPQGYIVS
jgi:hypothetical protein